MQALSNIQIKTGDYAFTTTRPAAAVTAIGGVRVQLIPVSVLDEESLEQFRESVWRLLGLVRVYLRHGGTVDEEPLALAPGATVEDVAHAIHHELAASFRAARLWGPSARFPGQRVGRAHVVADLDEVEILH